MATTPTEYVILMRVTEESLSQRSTYEVLAYTIEASGAAEARKRAAEREYADHATTDAVFVAVPARSFDPVAYSIETRPRAVTKAVVSR